MAVHGRKGSRTRRWRTSAPVVAALVLAGAAVAATPPAAAASPTPQLPDVGLESSHGGWSSFTTPTMARMALTPKPGPTNTGVPAGTKLQVVDGPGSVPAGTIWHNNTLKVTRDGTVLDALDVRGLVRIEAKNVVIKNSRITGRYLSSRLSLVYVDGSTYSVTIQDSELYAAEPSPYVNGVIGHSFTLERVNIHHVIDQVDVTGDDVVVRDSWLHDNLHYTNDPSRGGGPSHDDNVQVQEGKNIALVRNTMESAHNAAVQVTQDTGQVASMRIKNNHVSHGACSLNLAQKSYGPLRGFTVTGNVFTPTQVHRGCAMVVDAPSVPLLTLADNLWSDGAAVKVKSR